MPAYFEVGFRRMIIPRQISQQLRSLSTKNSIASWNDRCYRPPRTHPHRAPELSCAPSVPGTAICRTPPPTRPHENPPLSVHKNAVALAELAAAMRTTATEASSLAFCPHGAALRSNQCAFSAQSSPGRDQSLPATAITMASDHRQTMPCLGVCAYIAIP